MGKGVGSREQGGIFYYQLPITHYPLPITHFHYSIAVTDNSGFKGKFTVNLVPTPT